MLDVAAALSVPARATEQYPGLGPTAAELAKRLPAAILPKPLSVAAVRAHFWKNWKCYGVRTSCWWGWKRTCVGANRVGPASRRVACFCRSMTRRTRSARSRRRVASFGAGRLAVLTTSEAVASSGWVMPSTPQFKAVKRDGYHRGVRRQEAGVSKTAELHCTGYRRVARCRLYLDS